MAESKNNVITHGLSGKVGDLIVFRSSFGRTFVSSKPKERTGEQTEGQKAHQAKLQQAILYVKAAINDLSLGEVQTTASGDCSGVPPYFGDTKVPHNLGINSKPDPKGHALKKYFTNTNKFFNFAA